MCDSKVFCIAVIDIDFRRANERQHVWPISSDNRISFVGNCGCDFNWKQLQKGSSEDYCLKSVADYLQNLNTFNRKLAFLISNFRRVLNVVCFLLGNSPVSEFYMPMFRTTLSYLLTYLPMTMEQSAPNCVNISPIFYILISVRADIVPKYTHSCVAILEGDIKGKMSLCTPWKPSRFSGAIASLILNLGIR